MWRFTHLVITIGLDLIVEYPSWFILFCLLLGAGGAFFLYFRTKRDDLKPWIMKLMVALRFLSITILSFLLLSPLIKKTTETIEKPIIIIAQDNSLSVTSGKDSSFYRKDYRSKLTGLADELKKKQDVAFFSFGEKVSNALLTDFSEKQTDISELLDELNSRYSNRNVGAIILASDGIYNKGSNPYYTAQKLNCPLYTIALGDTIYNKDIILKKIIYNHTVFMGDKFPVEINIEADKCAGESTDVMVKKGDQVLFTRKILFTSGKSVQKVNILLEAREKGMQRYSVIVTPVNGEISKVNNQQDFFVEVSEARQKIAILYQSPHPDIAAIRSALESSLKFDVEEHKIDDFNQPPDKYDLIILYQLPSQLEISNLAYLINSHTSLLYCIGSETDLNAFNALKTGLEIHSLKITFIESLPQWNESFSLFTIDKSLLEVFKEFPPLSAPFGTFQFSPVSDILFYQKIGTVQSKIPLILFFQNSGQKVGIVAGENLWKWRLSDYQQKGNHDIFNEMLNKIAQYLSVKADKSFFRIKCNDKFPENGPVEFEAEVYNESYELINQPDVNLIITDENNKSYPFVFGKTDKAYYLNTGNFPVGTYKYQATVKVGNNLYQKKGEFVITPLNLEMMNSMADHNLLYRLARSHDGDMVYPRNMDHLAKMINNREDMKSVSYTQKRYADLAGNLWVFLLILALISAEWFIRKRNGIT